jgi:hypothetical protein
MSRKKAGRNFATTAQTDVPQGRKGKHNGVVKAILADLDRLETTSALKIELTELNDSKENVRSALNRATRKLKRNVATAADDEYLYVWNVTE